LNANTLTDEAMENCTLLGRYGGSSGKLRNDPEERSSHLLCGLSLKSRTDEELFVCSKLLYVVIGIELVEMKVGVRVCACARARACFRPPKNIRIPR
jgi:hypothetical protein